MSNVCQCQKITSIQLQAGSVEDLIICTNCKGSISFEALHISDDLKERLLLWNRDFGNWFDAASSTLIHGGEPIEMQHNNAGRQLATEIISELAENCSISFKSSAMYE